MDANVPREWVGSKNIAPFEFGRSAVWQILAARYNHNVARGLKLHHTSSGTTHQAETPWRPSVVVTVAHTNMRLQIRSTLARFGGTSNRRTSCLLSLCMKVHRLKECPFANKPFQVGVGKCRAHSLNMDMVQPSLT